MKYFRIVLIVSFVYAAFAMIVSREIVIPKMLSSVNGHINGDPQIYHSIAVKKVKEIHEFGFSRFELRPEGQGPAGVATLHYLVSESPYGIVLLHSLVHACSVGLLFLILSFWFSDKEALIGTLPLLISPYMIFWFSQLNKDSFTLFGILLFMYGLLKLIIIKEKLRRKLKSIILCAFGIFFIGLMRPYINQMLLPITLVGLLVIPIWNKYSKVVLIKFSAAAVILITSMVLCSSGAQSDYTLKSFEDFKNEYVITGHTNGTVLKCFASIKKENWKDAKFLPGYVNGKLRALMGQRCYTFILLEENYNLTTTYSIIDSDVIPNGSLEAIRYIPRAFLIGMLSPSPHFWLYALKQRSSMFYSIIPFEALLLYVGLICIFVWIIKNKKFTLFIPLGYSAIIMTIMAMANPSIAVLYRYRFPWWMLIMCIGVAAGTSLYQTRLKK
jgi:hypothetical protein